MRKRNRIASLGIMICLTTALCISALSARAQTADEPVAVILVASPNIAEQVYRRTVLIATAIEGNRHIGIIINRPTRRTLSSLFPNHGPSKAVVEPVFFGGPMSNSAIFAVTRGDATAGAGSIPLMKDLYLAITVNVVDRVIEQTPNQARYYVGNVLWRPGELQDEVRRGVWGVLNANPDVVFSKDPAHLWQELSTMTRGVVASAATY